MDILQTVLCRNGTKTARPPLCWPSTNAHGKRHMSPPAGKNVFPNSKSAAQILVCTVRWRLLPLKNPLNRRAKFPQTQNVQNETVAITPYYYDQVIWGMDLMTRCGILRTNPVHVPVMKCYFMVWTPKYSQLSTVHFDKTYANHVRKCAEFYMRNMYIPSVAMKRKDELEFGTIPDFVRDLTFK